MKKRKIAVIDLVTKGPTRAMWARVMHANFAGIMPQVVALWCEQEGHEVTLECYTGFEDILEDLPTDFDLVFVSAFSQSAQLAYAISNYFRSKGAITALGGPHARCYPQDSAKYFDYVLGFTDKSIIKDVLQDCSQHRPFGMNLSGSGQPTSLPGVRERWKYITQTLQKAPLIKIVPMLGSLGCPYTCSFCIDAAIDHEPFDIEVIKEDLSFLLKNVKRPRVGWHDPNFGIRFDEQLDAIEEVVPPDRVDFIAESSLSLLSEPHLKRLQRAGFKAILPGIESWYDMGNKSKTGSRRGLEKVQQVTEHVNMIMRYIPYLQANFVLGLDTDQGPDPFELTKRFIDWSPAAFPAYSQLSSFGRAAELNLAYQQEDRVLAFPFHFLNNNHAMNVKPKNYEWTEFYDNLISLSEYSFSWRSISRRLAATKMNIPRYLNFVRAVSSEGFGRIRYYKEIRRRLDEDPQFRPYFEQETNVLPQFYIDRIEHDLGPLWQWLPKGAIYHDPKTYLKEQTARQTTQTAEALEV